MPGPPNDQSLPSISVVTPSFNQGPFLEATIRSVLDQNYPNLEYAVVDGGSKDQSIDIIRKYEDRLAHWVSEPDKSHMDAVNKGFAKTSGEIMAFLNSDDMYLPWTLELVAEVFSAFPQVEWISSLFPAHWDKKGRLVNCFPMRKFSKKAFFRGEHLSEKGRSSLGWIQQEATFWRRSLWERAGGHVVEDKHLGGEFELWVRFFKLAELYGVRTVLAGFRKHGDQKTSHQMEEYTEACKRDLLAAGGRVSGKIESFFNCNVLGNPAVQFLLRKTGLAEPRRICYFDTTDARWKLMG